jgi:hypothetical protein
MKKTIGILAVLFCLMFASNALAVTDTVKLSWDVYNAATDGTSPAGYQVFRYTTDRNTNIKQPADGTLNGPPNNVHSFTTDFVVGTQYYFVAQAWVYGTDGVTINRSGDSTPPLPFIYRGAGNHYPPTGITIAPPTSFNIVDINAANWVRGAIPPSPVPVGYVLYYYKTSAGSGTKQSKFISGIVSTTTLTDITLDLNVEYTMYVVAVVYGLDGISYVESTASNTDVFTRRSGTSNVAPTAPKGFKITQ